MLRAMRWVASLLALGLMMAFVHHLTALGPLEARATLALGFLLIAAWLGGELAPRVRLPRVIGFLIVGFCVGPQWLRLVRADEIAALQFISDAAVALIALAAGSALELKTLGIGRVGLARLAGGAIAFPFAAVALGVLSVSPWFPLTRHLSFGSAAAVALVLAAFATISSPTLTMAIVDELDARGPFARAVLGVASAQAVVAAVVLSLVLVVARPLASPGALNAGVAWNALGRLGGSLAAGTLLGALVARYQALARRDGALLLAATGFLAATAARVCHVEAVLVGLAGGLYLANVSPVEGAHVARALRQQALSIYVVWFALAGAGLTVDALADLWPWVALLVGLRAVALRYGAQWAGREAEVTPALAREGWLGLISQAGVALGLAPMVRRALPASGVSLEALIVAVIAVHEVVGPICFRRALGRAGALKEGEHGGESTLAAQGGVHGGQASVTRGAVDRDAGSGGLRR
jgi:Kef-type K+ transport system membrane component KefB